MAGTNGKYSDKQRGTRMLIRVTRFADEVCSFS